MKQLAIVVLVIVLLSLTVVVCAQGGGGGGGGMRGGGMGRPTPAMIALGDFIYVELGTTLFKIDPKEMKVVGQVELVLPAPPPPAG